MQTKKLMCVMMILLFKRLRSIINLNLNHTKFLFFTTKFLMQTNLKMSVMMIVIIKQLKLLKFISITLILFIKIKTNMN